MAATAALFAPGSLRSTHRTVVGSFPSEAGKPSFKALICRLKIYFVTSFQLLLIDGDRLKLDPVSVMATVQDFLELEQRIGYEDLLRYDPFGSHLVATNDVSCRYNSKKGFYCVVGNGNKTQCLGKGKGRHYDSMSEEARRYLLNYYRPHNIALHRLLSRLGYSTPRWLQQELEVTL